ncbi:MAG: hypothetical protein IJ947_04855, partial [Phascolarctobacterium sp.]|nr:hypothetical protein [Phascolarctobacterium sp.]
KLICLIIFLVTIGLVIYNEVALNKTEPIVSYALESIPVYTGENYVVINDNNPDFTEEDLINKSYEKLSALKGAAQNDVRSTVPKERH